MVKYRTYAFDVLKCDRRFQLRWAKFPVIADELVAYRRAVGRKLRVLDVGVGRARIEQIYEHRYPDDEIDWYGFDLLDFRLDLAGRLPSIRRIQGNLEVGLPFRSGTFDAVLCSYVLQHIANPADAIREIARVLRRGGKVMLAIPSAPQPFHAVRHLVVPAVVEYRERIRGREHSYRPQVQLYNLPRLRRLVRAADLEPVRWQGLGLVTGGPVTFLENYEWYFRLHMKAGAILPNVMSNLVCVAVKPDGDGSGSPPFPRGRPGGSPDP